MTKHAPPLEPTSGPLAPASAEDPTNPWLGLQKGAYFFENEEISALIQRGLFYARAGVPIHFQGTPGRGKTAMALEIANRLGRPVSVMTGNDWMNSDDLIGKEVGQSSASIVDKYVQSVRRSESSIRYDWEDSILAQAMLRGHTLVYDEFTRSNDKANGILLSVLEEGVLVATNRLATRPLIHAHAQFRIILTSNPQDHVGVNATPDALLDRMVTFRLSRYAIDTECGIVATRTGLPPKLCQRIVHLVHDLHETAGCETVCSMRTAIMIAQIVAARLRGGSLSDALLAQIAADVLDGRGIVTTAGHVANYLAKNYPKEAV